MSSTMFERFTALDAVSPIANCRGELIVGRVIDNGRYGIHSISVITENGSVVDVGKVHHFSTVVLNGIVHSVLVTKRSRVVLLTTSA